MRDAFETLIRSTDSSQEALLDSMKDIFAAARPGLVYGEPLQDGDRTVITASEVVAGGGFGFGRGMGATPEQAASATNGAGAGGGGGGGGGGGSSARPVAIIVCGPDGVQVKPVLDVTKIALAALTAAGVALPMLARILRAKDG